MNPEILSALKQIEKERNIPLDMILQAIEDALIKAYEKHFGANQNVVIEIDRTTGGLHVWQRKLVVPAVEDAGTEMSLEEARELSEDAELGMEIDFEVPNDAFGRIAAQTAKQVIVQRIREFERNVIRDEYLKKQGDLMTGVVQRHERREVLLDLGRAEGVLPVSEQAHNEWFRHGDRVRALVVDVRDSQRGPQVVLSRSNPGLLKRLFELEVPEIRQGIVQVKAVVREAGLRSKIAVKSLDSSVDPVGACVGPKGSRVQAVVDELRGEKIDVIPWSDDPITFVANSLQPARVTRVTLYDETRNAIVVVPDHQLSLAIGREGQNARLAAKLTGWHIDIKSETHAKEMAEREAEKAAKAAPQPVAAGAQVEEAAATVEMPAVSPQADGDTGETITPIDPAEAFSGVERGPAS